MALKDAGLRPEDIDYINAHGTSTQLNDLTETLAIKKVFGEYAKKIRSVRPIDDGSSVGAAGSTEASLACWPSEMESFHDDQYDVQTQNAISITS